jgi:hypothetical protein
MYRLSIAACAGLIGALLAGACADSSRSLNPTAPSSITAAIDSLSADGGVAGPTGGPKPGRGRPENPGNGNGNGNGRPDNPGNGNGRPDEPGNSGNPGNGNPHVPEAPGGDQESNGRPPLPGNVTPPNVPYNPNTGVAQVQGVITAIAGSTITVRGEPVLVPETARIHYEDTIYGFDSLRVGTQVHVRAQITASGLQATQVTLQREFVVPAPPALPAVTVEAIDSDASETGPDAGTFQFTRTGDTTAPLTVTFDVSGTAENGSDYDTIEVTVTFLAGESTAVLEVTPVSDADAEESETVIVTVTDGASYDVGATPAATITIAS